MSDDFKPDRLQRLILVNQMRLLEALYPDEADEISVHREALEHGYELLYDWNVSHIYDGDDAMTREESLEVWNTLDMFDAINRFVMRSESAELANSAFAKFSGYDGNNETKFMAFTMYTVERLKRFYYVPMAKPGYYNSHYPARDQYRRMLAVWNKVPRSRRFELTKDEVEAILAAAIHPDHR